MKRLLALACVIALSGCGALQTAQSPIGDQTVSDARNALYIAKSLYGASVRVVTEYVKRPACEKPNAPVLCSNLATVNLMVEVRDAARIALDKSSVVIVNATGSSTVLNEAVKTAKGASEAFDAITKLHGGKT